MLETYSPPGTLSARLETLAAAPRVTADDLRDAATRARRLERLIDDMAADAMADAPRPPTGLQRFAVVQGGRI